MTDAQALCFYANSALYTGTDLDTRDALLKDLCPVGAPAEFGRWFGTLSTTMTRRRVFAGNEENMFLEGSYTVEFEASPTTTSMRVTFSGGTGGSPHFFPSGGGVFGYGCVPPTAP